VTRQEAAHDSTLNHFRAFLRWRRAHPVLMTGDIRFLDAPEPLVVFVRGESSTQILAAFNLSSRRVAIDLAELSEFRQVDSAGVLEGELRGDRLIMQPHGAVFASRRVDS